MTDEKLEIQQKQEIHVDGLIFDNEAGLRNDFGFYADNVYYSWLGSYSVIDSYEPLIKKENTQEIAPHRAIRGYMDVIIPKNTQTLEIEFDGLTFIYPVELRSN